MPLAGESRLNDQPDVVLCASYLKALGDPWRLQIVRALQNGPLSVSDLALLLEIEVANVSHHLRVLFHAGLVKTERDGRFIYYHLNQEFLNAGGLKHALNFGCCEIDLGETP